LPDRALVTETSKKEDIYMQYRVLRKAAVLAVALILGLGIYFTGCSKKGTEPEPTTKQYPVYFIAGDPNIADDELCYQYYPGTGEIDSFPLLVWPNRHMSVSADGKQLWISTYDTIYVFDIETKSIVGEISLTSGWTKAVFSSDNRLAAFSYTELFIIDAHDYSVIFSDTSATLFGSGHFSFNGERYYTTYNGNHAYVIDLSDNINVTHHLFDNLGFIQEILPSIDETLWFIVTRATAYHSGFFVYDTSIDSIIYSELIAPQPVRIKRSPCGKNVYLTAGGTLNSIDPFPFSFAIFDIQTNQFIDEVNIAMEDISWPYFPLDHFVVTPDGRYLMGRWFVEPWYIAVYDFLCQDTVSIIRLGEKYSGIIECQVGL
jgi:hypothetical protein